MKILGTAISVLALSATTAAAGGLDRSGQGIGVMYEDGDYVQLSFGSVTPNVSGTYAGGAFTSGNMAPNYTTYAFGYRNQISDQLAIGLVFDQPYGADVNYTNAGTFAGLVGTTVDFASSAVTLMGQYQLNENVSLLAGVKSQSVAMSIAIPGGGALNYRATGESSQAFGYVLGAAYEIPEIALRAALTYHSAVSYDIPTTEFSVAAPGGVNSVTKLKLPQAVNLDFQTGIAADTLLTASVRWANWKQTVIAPDHYNNALGRGILQSYSQDVYTYSLGVGRRFTDNFAASLTLGYEAAQGSSAANPTGNLAPTDGFVSLTLGGSYTMDNVELSGGVRYVRVGDATSSGAGGAQGTFSGNSAIGVGVGLGVAF